MYRIGWSGTLLVATMLCTACQGGGERAAEQPQSEKHTAVTAGEVKQETQEALVAAQQYARQQKEAYQQQMQRQMEELNTQIAALKERTNQAGADAREDLHMLQQDVEQKLEAARKQLAELQTARVETWEVMKVAVDTALQDVRKSYEEFRARSSDKVSTSQ